jgi:pimeloyl-ACP methyl ester carboxylesterase
MAPATNGRLQLATGIATGYTEDGDPDGRPALLLLHAWAESRYSFARLVPLLPPWLRTIAVDLRGHGDADKPPGGYGLPSLAADVLAAMDRLDLPSAVLVGSSSGGYVAQQVAVDAPARVAGLVLAGVPRDLRGRPSLAGEIETLTDPVDREWARRFVTGLTRAESLPGWFVEQRVADALRLPAATWRATLEGLCTSDPPTVRGPIAVPALVVSGDDDELLDLGQTAALVADLPGARWLRYPGTGHCVLWEQPARLAADITEFLATVAPGGP